MDEIDGIIKTINEHKGELLAKSCLLRSIVRALALEQRAKFLEEFDIERDHARVVLLNSRVPEDVVASFDLHIAAFNDLRHDRPRG